MIMINKRYVIMGVTGTHATNNQTEKVVMAPGATNDVIPFDVSDGPLTGDYY